MTEPTTLGSAKRTGPKVTGRTRDLVIALDRGILAFSRHWLLFFNLFIALYLGLPFLAPVFMEVGWDLPARVIYTVYSVQCHQLGYRSWYLFGEQSNYPSAVFQADTGINTETTEGFIAARAFVGNLKLGYKVALCERDVAIYGFMLLAGMLFGIPAVRRRLKPLPWWAWVLLGVAPIGLDGFWQLFTNYPYTALFPILLALPHHDSTAFLRSLTGGLFGVANIWLAYPYFEQSMAEAREELRVKLARVDAEAARHKAGAAGR